MDELEFLRGLEGEEQAGTDLVSGAEHFVRLKKQVGLQKDPEEGLELSKEASTLLRDFSATLDRVGEHATAFGKGVKNNMRFQGMGLKGAILSHKNSTKQLAKTEAKGGIAGAALPAILAGSAGYAAGSKFGKEKKAEVANRLMSALKKIDPGLLASMGIGATTAGVGTYLASRPQDNGKGRAEEQLEQTVQNHEAKPAEGLGGKMHQANTKLLHGYAKAFRDHPIKASLLGATTGASLGYGIGRLAGANKPSIEAIKKALRGGK